MTATSDEPPCFPLHFFAGSSSVVALDAAKDLLDLGLARVNEREPDSQFTPLHVAATWGNVAMCQLLVHYGADPTIRDGEGLTAIDLAEKKAVRRFLKAIGSNSRPRRKNYLRRLLTDMFSSNALAKKRNSTGTPSSKSHRASCIPAFQPLTQELIRRRSSHLRDEFKQPDDQEIAALLDTLRIVGETADPIADSLVAMSSLIASDASATCLYPQITAAQPSLPSEPVLVPPPVPPRDSSFTKTSSPRKPEEIRSRISPTSDQDANNINKRPLPPVPTPHVQSEPPSTPPACNVFKYPVTPTAPLESDNEGDDAAVVELDMLTPLRTPEVPNRIRDLPTSELKRQLLKHGVSPGPMTRDNRRLYERKLASAEKQNARAYEGQEYSRALDRRMKDPEGTHLKRQGQLQEDIIRNEFCSGPVISREKNEVSSFCYLLIDPSKIADQENCTFRQFIESVFYIGKGKRSRPLQHLIDAAKCNKQEGLKGKPKSEKLKRICRLWQKGYGVISLQVFSNIHPMEAFVREAGMLDAFGLKNLTNLKGGEYSGNAKCWTLREKTEFGTRCLISAWGVFRNERCRPVFENDLADALAQKFFY